MAEIQRKYHVEVMRSVDPTTGKRAISVGGADEVSAPPGYQPILHTHPRGTQFTPSEADYQQVYMKKLIGGKEAAIEGVVSQDGITYYGFKANGERIAPTFLPFK
jgi:hypothetical protein